MATEVMKFMGVSSHDAKYRAKQFMRHDEKNLRKSFEFFDKEPELISFTRQATGELEHILREDIKK